MSLDCSQPFLLRPIWYSRAKVCRLTDSVHTGDDLVDQFFTVAPDASVCEWMSLLFPSVLWGVELDWPEEVVSLFEGWSDGPNLVDKIFDAVNALRSESASNDAVVSQGNS